MNWRYFARHSSSLKEQNFQIELLRPSKWCFKPDSVDLESILNHRAFLAFRLRRQLTEWTHIWFSIPLPEVFYLRPNDDLPMLPLASWRILVFCFSMNSSFFHFCKSSFINNLLLTWILIIIFHLVNYFLNDWIRQYSANLRLLSKNPVFYS